MWKTLLFIAAFALFFSFFVSQKFQNLSTINVENIKNVKNSPSEKIFIRESKIYLCKTSPEIHKINFSDITFTQKNNPECGKENNQKCDENSSNNSRVSSPIKLNRESNEGDVVLRHPECNQNGWATFYRDKLWLTAAHVVKNENIFIKNGDFLEKPNIFQKYEKEDLAILIFPFLQNSKIKFTDKQPENFQKYGIGDSGIGIWNKNKLFGIILGIRGENPVILSSQKIQNLLRSPIRR